ncbi:hypothetical protein ASF84_24885 [Pseudomonas sp. Leaf127]|uniref:RES family NAD+ phosphorylase n=1 Tax=Pseudomonas sp. Leaf127 TaxID=1736267 RepID=UPI000702A3C8|nr:RES family NAD+ phosphorylase [Pseudomonas sp. Leaf127]KQQ65529.1 hypothetical protein ASF84_24885 [Pseudomonas sp. Leaf127]
MIRIYRLIKRRWLAQAFDGEVASRHGGRWNSKGQACVYGAGSQALARLETLMHLNDGAVMRHFAMLELALDEEQVLHLPCADLPADWRGEPAPATTAWLGDQWLASNQSLALAVPSVQVAHEFNYLLNPRYPGFAGMVEGAINIYS